MNCWKSVNIKKDYDSSWLFLTSMCLMIAVFLLSFLAFSLYYQETNLQALDVYKTLAILILVFPIHSLLHYLPLLITGAKVTYRLRSSKYRIPSIKVSFVRPVSKNVYLIAMLCPNLVITSTAFIGASIWTPYMHYFLLIGAFNAGLSVYDFIYIRQLFSAPRHCLVEQRKDRVDILFNHYLSHNNKKATKTGSGPF